MKTVHAWPFNKAWICIFLYKVCHVTCVFLVFFFFTECQCSLDYSNDSACETYGGQCQCIERGEQIGRQCTACLHSSYLNDTLGVCLSK